ncbi:TPA: hypothetical protein ACH3X3_010125 [Trebouxia sp. C0006]
MPLFIRKETVAVAGIVTVICAVLYPTVIAPTLIASQPKQNKHSTKADAGFVKKGVRTEMKQQQDKTI